MKLLSEANQNGSLPDLEKSVAFTDLKDAILKTPANSSAKAGIGLEPTTVLRQKKTYYDTLNNIRRNNMGDDTADSAGYGLYLVRLPTSVQPGDKTARDHGAQVTISVRPEFEPDFLTQTFRSLVINDLVDQLGPLIFEMVRSGLANDYDQLRKDWDTTGGFNEVNFHRAKYNELYIKMVEKSAIYLPTSRTGQLAYPISPNDLPDVFGRPALLYLALAAQNVLEARGQDLNQANSDYSIEPRATDVMAYLRRELESAYDLMVGPPDAPGPLANIGLIETEVLRPVLNREFDPKAVPSPAPTTREETWEQYHSHSLNLAAQLPGDIRNRSMGALAWAIAVDASLLNVRLRTEIRRMDGRPGFTAPPDLDTIFFYSPLPTPQAEAIFRDYVRARWPIITFGIDPVTDEQNIAEAFDRFRDIQLALAFSFSTGRINFNQFNRFRRQVSYEASTIALNRTVTAFALGDSTFGWRMSPRYQTPPEEGSNLKVFANLLLSGGPGPDYQVRKSKLEAGQRELSAAIIMPSFLTRVRFEVAGNWYRLSDPDEVTLKSNHLLEQSRRVYELKDALACVCDADRYPPDALARFRTKVEHLEAMLPAQTQIVDVPYENRLGGFDLFTPGASSLVPQLIGYQGAPYVTGDGQNSILLIGKNLSIMEYAVVAGGQRVPNGNVTILSREVISVTLPKGLLITKSYSSDRKKTPTGLPPIRDYVEVHIASPNGVSNRLLIPYQSGAPATTAAEVTPPAAPAPAGDGAPKQASLSADSALAKDAGVRAAQYQQGLPPLPASVDGLTIPPVPAPITAVAAQVAAARRATTPSTATPTQPPVSQTVVVVPQPTTVVTPPPPKQKRDSILGRIFHRE
jgi:hypothetical protein